MDNTVAITFLSVFINRLTEAIKRGFINGLPLSDDAKGTVILLISFLLGVLGVIFIFPTANLVPTAGVASPLAAQIVTGIIIAGLANGIDFLGQLGGAAVNKASAPSATISLGSGSATATGDAQSSTGTVTVSSTTADTSPTVKAQALK